MNRIAFATGLAAVRLAAVRLAAVRLAVAGLATFAVVSSASAQTTSFFANKQMTILVGTTAGGGYDTYARMIARHMPKHIPGTPNIIVSNMPGAGSNVAANYIYNVAPKDGTWIGSFFAGAPLEPLLGTTPVQHDPRKSQYLGSANNDVYICMARKDAEVQSFEDLYQKELMVGAGTTSTTSDFPLVLNAALGTKFKLVLGYPGSREVGMSIDRKETWGACGFAWPSIAVTNPGWFGKDGTMRILAQTHPTGHPDLNKEGVPNAINMTKDPTARAMLDVFFSQMVFGRPYVVAPQVPKDRVDILRKAFAETLADPELLVEAKRANLDVDPVSGEDVQKLIEKVYNAPPDVIERLRKALQGNKG